MKNISKIALLLSFLVLCIMMSVLSMTASAENLRYTWAAINPWNGVEGVAFTIGYYLSMGATVTYIVTIALLTFIWWRLYALISRFF